MEVAVSYFLLWLILINILICCGSTHTKSFDSILKIKRFAENDKHEELYNHAERNKFVALRLYFTQNNKFADTLKYKSTSGAYLNHHINYDDAIKTSDFNIRPKRDVSKVSVNPKVSDNLDSQVNLNKSSLGLQHDESPVVSRPVNATASARNQTATVVNQPALSSSSNIYSDIGETQSEEFKDKGSRESGSIGSRLSGTERHSLSGESPMPEAVNEVPFNTSVKMTGNETDNWNQTLERFVKLYPVDIWKEKGWFTDDFLRTINIHWMQFPPPPRIAHYIMAAIYMAMSVAGTFGNILVIFMFFKCRSLRTPANILVVNLAVSDFLMISKTPLFIYNSINLGPATGHTGCQIFGFVGGLTGTVSIGTLAAIAFDRYTVVVYPLEPLRSISGLRAKLSVVLVWLYGIFFAIIPALDIGLGRYVPEGYLTSCSFDYLSDDPNHKIFIFSFFCAAWVLPFLIIFFCYTKILRVVISTRSLGRKTAGSMRHCKEQEKRSTELKLAGVVIVVIGLFFAAWTPYAIVALLGISGYRHLIFPLSSMIPAVFCKVASCIDPFIYVVTHPKFRQECENLLLTKKEKHRRSTVRQGWSVGTSTKAAPHDQDTISDDGVEEVQMGNVPYANDETASNVADVVNQSGKRGLGLSSVSPGDADIDTISSHAVTKGAHVELPKSLQENAELQPPSWYVKPQFAQRGNSIKNVVKKSFRRKKSEEASA